MAFKGGAVSSLKKLQSDLKKKGRGGNKFLKRIPADDEMPVRFLTEPIADEENGIPGWTKFYEHFTQEKKFFPCTGDPSCDGCQAGERATERYLANAVTVDDGEVVPMVLPTTLATKLVRKYERHHTLIDRDYLLIRTGAGFDTEYDTEELPVSKMNLKKYALLDLEEMIEAQLPDEEEEQPKKRRASLNSDGVTVKRPRPVVVEDDDDDDEEEEVVRRPAKASQRRSQPVVEEPDDEDDEEEESVVQPVVEEDDEDEEEPDLRSTLKGKRLSELKQIADEEYGIAADDLDGLDKNDVLDAILEVASLEDDEEDEGDDGEGTTQYTSAELRSMSIAELKDIADTLGIKHRANSTESTLKAKILEKQAELAPDEDDENEPPF